MEYNFTMARKTQLDYIKECIAELVYPKTQIKKAYNYYHAKRDPAQFRHIEENYGLGSATTLSFTPLIKKHIDVLVGEYLELDPSLDITCRDDQTIDHIMRDKQLKIAAAVNKRIQDYIEDSIKTILSGKDADPNKDAVLLKEIEDTKKSLEKSYISDYEIAAYNIIDYFKQSRDIDMLNKLRELFTDLLVTGTCYYRVRKTAHKPINFEVLNPLDTFIERTPGTFYLNKSARSCVRRWLTVEQILTEYGDELTQEAKDNLIGNGAGYNDGTENYIHTDATISSIVVPSKESTGILGGLEVSPIYPGNDTENGRTTSTNNLIQVFECE